LTEFNEFPYEEQLAEILAKGEVEEGAVDG